MKGLFALNRLRAILAILIALSLTLAPITSAWAATQMRMSMQGTATVAATEDAMSDCMKAMQAKGERQSNQQNCPCCDTPAKGACPDVGACLAKCSVQVIAVLEPAGVSRPPIMRHNRPTDPQRPPDWSRAPPAPPPRA